MQRSRVRCLLTQSGSVAPCVPLFLGERKFLALLQGGRGRGAWSLAGQHLWKGRGRGRCLGRGLTPLEEKGLLLFSAGGDGGRHQGGGPLAVLRSGLLFLECTSQGPCALAPLRLCPTEIWTVGQERAGEALLTFLHLSLRRASGSPRPLRSAFCCHPHLWALAEAEAGCSPCSPSPLRLLGCGTDFLCSILSGRSAQWRRRGQWGSKVVEARLCQDPGLLGQLPSRGGGLPCRTHAAGTRARPLTAACSPGPPRASGLALRRVPAGEEVTGQPASSAMQHPGLPRAHGAAAVGARAGWPRRLH